MFSSCRDDLQVLLEDELVQGRLGGPVGALDVQFGDADNPAGGLQVPEAGDNLVLQVGGRHVQVHLRTDARHLRIALHIVTVGLPLGVDRLEVVIVQVQDCGLAVAGQGVGRIGERLVHPVLGALEIPAPDEDIVAGGVPRRAELDGPVGERLVHDVPTVHIKMFYHRVHPVTVHIADDVVHKLAIQAEARVESGRHVAGSRSRLRRGRDLDIVKVIRHRLHAPVKGEREAVP